jgi:hypothetical protein
VTVHGIAFPSKELFGRKKKADVAKCAEAFNHVGLLCNEPSSYAELPFIQSSDGQGQWFCGCRREECGITAYHYGLKPARQGSCEKKETRLPLTAGANAHPATVAQTFLSVLLRERHNK